MSEMKSTVIPSIDIISDIRSRDWCKLPYPNHPHGCPNYDKRIGCPPQVSLFNEVITSPYTLVGIKFNLEKWINRMKDKHPNWSDKQARCCLYWQGKVRKVLREKCKEIVKDEEMILYKPEAMGIHVFRTCASIGIKLEKNPTKYVWKIAIIGRKK